MEPTVYCCGLTVVTSTGNTTAAPTGVVASSAATPAWGLRSFVSGGQRAEGRRVLVQHGLQRPGLHAQRPGCMHGGELHGF